MKINDNVIRCHAMSNIQKGVTAFIQGHKNIKNKDYIRSNIEQIFKDKIIDIPILKNDTNNVIEFNDTFENEMNEEKKRSY